MSDLIGGVKDILEIINYMPLPQIGVGGGVEAKKSVDLIETLKFTFVFILGIGALFGVGLAFAAKKFSVKRDPRIEQVRGVLAGAHCGACGYAGCEQYAEAVVTKPDVPPNLCTPGGEKTAKLVAMITGKEAADVKPKVARVLCQGSWSRSVKRFKYEGVQDCRAVVLASGGDKACTYGCLGYGTCANVCPFGAIHMSEDNLPVIDEQKCTGCGKCEAACPKNVIKVIPVDKAVVIACNSKDRGPDTRKNCQIGCIGCGMCVKVCPFEAISLVDNLSRIDFEKCKVCGLCVMKCPTNAIVDYIPVRTKAFVIEEKCIGCNICKKVCPVDAAEGEMKKPHKIDQSKCIGCGICAIKCPAKAISLKP